MQCVVVKRGPCGRPGNGGCCLHGIDWYDSKGGVCRRRARVSKHGDKSKDPQKSRLLGELPRMTRHCLSSNLFRFAHRSQESKRRPRLMARHQLFGRRLFGRAEPRTCMCFSGPQGRCPVAFRRSPPDGVTRETACHLQRSWQSQGVSPGRRPPTTRPRRAFGQELDRDHERGRIRTAPLAPHRRERVPVVVARRPLDPVRFASRSSGQTKGHLYGC